MTEVEQQKIAALMRVKLHPIASLDVGAIAGFKWLMEHDKEGPLTPILKFQLEHMLWRYRRQLSMKSLAFLLPEICPVKSQFFAKPKYQPQENLF